MAFADIASRKLLHGAGGAIARGVTADAVRMSFGLDGLWRLIAGLFGSAVHLLVLPFEALWHMLQTAAAGVAHLLVLPFEALWQLIHGFFASLLAALGSAAHVFAVPFEAISQWLQTAAMSVSFGFDGLWQYIQGIFPNLLATLAGAAHKLLLPFEAFWRWIQTTVADAAAGISFGLDGFWPLIRRLFANILATVATAAHELVPAVESSWRWLKTAAAVALPTVLLIAAVVCLVALVWFCGTSFCAAAVPVAQAPVSVVGNCGLCLRAAGVGIAKALVHFVCYSWHCLHVVAMGLGRVLVFLVPVCKYCCHCCVSVTMKAPGAAGFVISRAAFVANPQLYFLILHSADAVVASAVFCTTTVASAVAAPVAALFRF